MSALIERLAAEAQEEIRRMAAEAREELRRLAEKHNRSRGQMFRRDRVRK